MAAKPKKTTRKTTTAKKSPKSKSKAPTKRTPSHGRGQLNSGGTPGNKGGTGRPPNEVKEFIRKVLSGRAHRKAYQRALEDDKHPHFGSLTSKAHLFVIGVPNKAEPEDPGNTENAVVLLVDL